MTHAREIPDVTLPDGTRMPIVGFGTWRLRGNEAYQAVRAALDLGYRHLDTATMYANEAEVGRAVRDSGVPRADLYITTKLPAERAKRARKTIEESVHALGVDHVDLWLIHWPPNGNASVGVWEDLLAARTAGLTTSVGVSNYDPDQIDELVKATGELPAVNQIPWYPSRHDPALLVGHRERGVVVEGYSPLKGSDLKDPVLTTIATAHDVTVPQVILRWHLEHQIVIIPKSVSPERMAANLDIFDFTLTPEEIANIDALAS